MRIIERTKYGRTNSLHIPQMKVFVCRYEQETAVIRARGMSLVGGESDVSRIEVFQTARTGARTRTQEEDIFVVRNATHHVSECAHDLLRVVGDLLLVKVSF